MISMLYRAWNQGSFLLFFPICALLLISCSSAPEEEDVSRILKERLYQKTDALTIDTVKILDSVHVKQGYWLKVRCAFNSHQSNYYVFQPNEIFPTGVYRLGKLYSFTTYLFLAKSDEGWNLIQNRYAKPEVFVKTETKKKE